MTARERELPGHDAVATRAAAYFERRRFGGWSEADQAELDAWFKESALHEVAYLRLEGAVEHTERLAARRPSKPNARTGGRIEDGRRKYRRLFIPLLAAASVVMAVALGRVWLGSLTQPPDRTLTTNVGGRAVLKFTDGTEIDLNTSTAVRYRMTTAERIVWLDKGEAYFRVAHNAANPFTVVAGGHRVTDLGTEFLVRDEPGDVDVALVKGRAQLSSENPGTPSATLAPDYEAVATPFSITVTKKSTREIADELAWQRGVLIFRNTRLADAVKQFNRYNEIKLVIADSSIANVKFSAEARTNDYDGFLRLAQAVLKLRVDRVGNEILLSRGDRDEAKRVVPVKHGR